MKIHTHALKTGDRQAIDAFMNSIHLQDAMAAADAMRTSDVRVGVFDDGMNLIAIVFGNAGDIDSTFYISSGGYDASRSVAMVKQVLARRNGNGNRNGSGNGSGLRGYQPDAAGSGPIQAQRPTQSILVPAAIRQRSSDSTQLRRIGSSGQTTPASQAPTGNQYPTGYGMREPIQTIDQKSADGDGKGKKKKGGAVKKALVAILAVAAIGGIAAGGVVLYPRIASRLGIASCNKNEEKHWQIGRDEQATLTIDPGDTVTHVKSKLYKLGFASTADIIADYLSENDKLENLQAGTYTLVGSEKPEDIIERLINGVTTPTTVVGVNVGNTLNDIAATIDAKKLKFTGADFLAYTNNPQAYKASYAMMGAIPDNLPSIEGFIPAGVYNLADCETPEAAIEVMLEAGEKRYEASGQTPEQWWQNLIIGSMIEKEALFDEDRANISSVIHNRLARNMKLGIDATVKYATGKNDARVYDSDTQVDSPYNTYRVAGLPLGPICSAVGDKSMDAAANPAQTGYIYYVLKDKEGHHAFSDNAAQFEQDKQAYLQLFGYQ